MAMSSKRVYPALQTNRRHLLRHNETMNVATHSLARGTRAGLAALVLAAVPWACLADSSSVYYVCPGNVFTNTITRSEAEAQGCKAKEAQQATIIPAPKPRPVASPGGPSAAKVDPGDQKERDSDARRILQDELAKSQAQLDSLNKQYNNGQPERQGGEKNYQKYLDRTAELKAQITRVEADIDALKRELAKLQ